VYNFNGVIRLLTTDFDYAASGSLLSLTAYQSQLELLPIGLYGEVLYTSVDTPKRKTLETLPICAVSQQVHSKQLRVGQVTKFTKMVLEGRQEALSPNKSEPRRCTVIEQQYDITLARIVFKSTRIVALAHPPDVLSTGYFFIAGKSVSFFVERHIIPLIQ